MSTESPSGQDPYDPRFPERLPPGFVPPRGDQPAPPTAPAGDPLAATDLAGWFERLLSSVRRCLTPLLVLQGLYAVASAVFQVLYGGKLNELATMTDTDPQVVGERFQEVSTQLALPGGVLLLISLFLQAASMYVIIRYASGTAAGVGAALAFSGRRMPLIVAWAIAAGLLIMIGCVLFLIPGLYLFIVAFSGLAGAVLVEKRGLDRAIPLVNRRFLATTGRIALFVAASMAYGGLVNLLVSVAGSTSFAGAVVGAVLGIPIGIAQSAYFVVTYAELRRAEDPDFDTRRLVAELDA